MENQVISGRKDFDVVDFKDYAQDMKELGDQALALHRHYQREIRELNRLVWWLVLAAGGKIEVGPEHTMYDLPDINWKIEDKPYNMTKTYEAYTKARRHVI